MTGGSTRAPIMTAYRQQALACASALSGGPQRVRDLRKDIPDAGKIFVRLYPGPLSQVVEGMDAILRMPGGCFEQTSSSAYPNVLTVDYLKKTHTQSPAVMMKAEQYLNAGYQRLLTFEHHPNGPRQFVMSKLADQRAHP